MPRAEARGQKQATFKRCLNRIYDLMLLKFAIICLADFMIIRVFSLFLALHLWNSNIIFFGLIFYYEKVGPRNNNSKNVLGNQ